MSLMLAPVPAAPDAPTFTPPETAPQIERAPRFGPALSDAQDRLARAESPREPARRPRDPERPGRADDRRPPKAKESVDDDAADRHVKDTAADSDAAEASEVAEVEGDEPTETDADVVATGPTPMATDAVAVFADLPVADGAEGAGDPSMSDSLEEAAAPTVTDELVPVDEASTEATSLVASADERPTVAEALPAATAEAVAPFVLASRATSEPATASEVPAAEVTVDAAAAAEAPMLDGGGSAEQLAPTHDLGAGATDAEAVDDATIADSTPLEAVDAADAADVAATGPTSETETAEAVAPKPLPAAAVTTDAPDRMVVRAGEAAATDIAKAAGAPQTADGPEGSLWEDVRSAFERIRSNGDTNEVRIRLRPAELGELIVQVRTQGDHVAVRLLASSAAAQQALLDDRLRLASELALAGFEEGSVDIDQQSTGDQRSQNGQRDGDGEDRPAPRSIDMLGGLDHVGSVRERFERRSPIHTEIGFRPGRHAYSTINLTL